MSGGEMTNILGTSLLGYFAGRKGQKRQGEIAERAAMLSDPFARQRGYYQGILADMYGMPEGYGARAPEGKSQNELMRLFDLFSSGDSDVTKVMPIEGGTNEFLRSLF